MLTTALKLGDCSPEVRRPFLPRLLTLAPVRGRGPQRSHTRAGRGRGDEPEANVMSIFPKRLLWEPLEGMNEITDAWLILKKKKKKKLRQQAVPFLVPSFLWLILLLLLGHFMDQILFKAQASPET